MYYSNGVSSGGGEDSDAIGTGVQQQMVVAGQQSFVTVAHGSDGESSDGDGWISGKAWKQQLDLRYNGGVVEASGAPGGGVPEVTGGAEVTTFLELVSAVMLGLFTEVSSRCSLFVPSPPTPPLRCCPQSPPFLRTAARVLRSFLGTPVLSSMASLPGIASTTDGSRVCGSITCVVTASVYR